MWFVPPHLALHLSYIKSRQFSLGKLPFLKTFAVSAQQKDFFPHHMLQVSLLALISLCAQIHVYLYTPRLAQMRESLWEN